MNIAHFIDHTILKADAPDSLVRQYCEEAIKEGFASVCVNSYYVPIVADLLRGSGIACCSVVGFPLGAMSTAAKAFEAHQAVQDGADEIDMVINISAIKSGRWDLVEEDIRAVTAAAAPAPVKVILETCLLTDEEKRKACSAAESGGAAFVKTSTGLSTGGATVKDVRLMKEAVGDRLKIKASGGIRTKAFAVELLEAGADRIGAGNGMLLLKD